MLDQKINYYNIIFDRVYIAEDKVALTWDHMITKLGDSLGSSSLQSGIV
jgi:hypothetical protein